MKESNRGQAQGIVIDLKMRRIIRLLLIHIMILAVALPVSAQLYDIKDLGTLGGTSSVAYDINDRGQIVGESATTSGEEHAFLWENGQITDLETLGGDSSTAYAINNNGQIVGMSVTASGEGHAFLWENGQMTDLGTLGGDSSTAQDINERGQIVGGSSTVVGDVYAFILENGQMTNLGSFGGTSSLAFGINDHGQVVGISSDSLGYEHAFIWENGTRIDLGTLGGTFSDARDVNDGGAVVGGSTTSEGEEHGFLWINGVMSDLGVSGPSINTPISIAFAFNELGQIVGEGTVASGEEHAFIWENGQMIDLGTLGGTFSAARGINNKGQIVGESNIDLGRHAVLWTVIGPATWTVDDSGGADFIRIQDAIDNASDGDTILVYSGTYFENVNVNKQLILYGIDNGGGKPVVDAGGIGSPITLSVNGITLKGFTVTGVGLSGYNNPEAGIKVTSDNNTLIGNIAFKNGDGRHGIGLYSSSNNTLIDNNVFGNGYGISLEGSSNNMLNNNFALNNFDIGISLSYSINNMLIGNNISNSGRGIVLSYSSSNMLNGNNVSNSFNCDGITLEDSSNNTLRGNNALENNCAGISLSYSGNNKLIDNNASNNGYGIYLSSSSNNIIYNNYFSNINNAYDDGSNLWNITKMSGTNIHGGGWFGGNYWSDYAGQDTDDDGLGDTLLPYNSAGSIINGGDFLPLSLTNPIITGFSPISPVYNMPEATRTFSITINTKANATWLINGTEIFGETGVTISSYTNTSASLGTWNVTAIAINANGTFIQEWIWMVKEASVHNLNTGKNFLTIQAAIDDAGPGDEIHVDSGTYYENVNVNKQIILRGIDNGGGKPIVDASGSESAITLSANGSTLEGFDTRNSGWSPYAGIYVSSGGNVIKNNNASGNANGISLDSSSNNTLSGNNASNNGYGISLSSSSNNMLSGNNALNNGYGISLSSSSNNTLNDNYANSNNGYGISMGPDSNNNIMNGNSASNNGDYGISLGSDSNNNIMNGNNASNNLNGIVIGSFNNTLSDNNANSNKWIGIALVSANNNTLRDNNANSNNGYGISLDFYSDNNMLSDNNANSNNLIGIFLFDSSNNILRGNNANSNNNHGILLDNYASNNILSDNNANSNNRDGISIRDSFSNTLNGNTVSSNILYGILLDYSDGNIIYNNYFNNTNNSYFNSFNGLILSNTWNITKTAGTNIIDGTYLGGNFWANPNGTGFSQTCSDNDPDGICDSPYTLESSNIDYLPLTIASTPTTDGSISGYKINDTNGNRRWDAGELGIENWTIRLIGITGKGNNTKIIRKETFTDTTGFYIFGNLPAGRYFVIEKLKKGFVPTSSPAKRMKLAQDENSVNNNFTNRPINSLDRIDGQSDVDDYEAINRNIDRNKENIDWD